MRELQLTTAGSLPAIIDELFRTFGFWQTLKAFIPAAWRRHRTLNQLSHLSDHLRRDIGVEEAASPSDGAVMSLWASPVGYPVLRRD